MADRKPYEGDVSVWNDFPTQHRLPPSLAGKVLHSTEDFQMEYGQIQAGDMAGFSGYVIRNKHTGIIEGESVAEAQAVRGMHFMQKTRTAVLANPGEEDEMIGLQDPEVH